MEQRFSNGVMKCVNKVCGERFVNGSDGKFKLGRLIWWFGSKHRDLEAMMGLYLVSCWFRSVEGGIFGFFLRYMV